jgi:DMSO/TMAO reductase YedYZ molybdopterin-dependent catalytic subunit
MSSAALNRLLALLLAAAALTGVLTLRAGAGDLAWVFISHGLVGGVLLAVAIAKLRASIPRAVRAGDRTRIGVGLLVTVLAAASVLGGFAWVAGARLVVIGPWTLVTWHIVAGIALALVLVGHLAPRRWRLLVPGRRAPTRAAARLSRRSFLAGSAFAVAGFGLWAGAETLDRILGGVRRFTGSRWLPAGGVPPATTFLGEGTPAIDVTTWRLSVVGAVERPLELDLAALAALGLEHRTATLDCTSGWAIETSWEGVQLGRVLDAAGASPTAAGIVVRAVTGWGASLGLDEARDCLLATGVAGRSLPAGNGAPCRLVVPGRRGLDWVKWVSEIEVRSG